MGDNAKTIGNTEVTRRRVFGWGAAGGVATMTDFTRASLTGERPFDVDPAVIPGVVMNCAAAQCASRRPVPGVRSGRYE